MRLTGEKGRGATLDSNEQVECLAELNTFMDACATERLLCYTVQQDSLALTASTSTYTIGSGGAFNVTRPTKIVDPCFVRDGSRYDSPVKVINAESYGRIVDKGAGFTVPQYLYYDAGYSATSTGTIFLYPSPSASLTLFINSWKQPGQFSTLSQTVMLPPGYQEFIEYNFALRMASGLAELEPTVLRIARESKARVAALNAPEPISRLDYSMPRSNIFTGP